MFEMSKLVKEEITKNIIDKLIFGLLASIIFFGMQRYSERYDREQLQREALLQIESRFIIDGSIAIKNSFSLYLKDVSKFLTNGVQLENDKHVQLVEHRIELEAEIEVLSAYHYSLKSDGNSLIEAMRELNGQIFKFSGGSVALYENKLSIVKNKYRQFLLALKQSAILALTID